MATDAGTQGALRRRPFGSWLLGPADQSPAALWRRIRLLQMVLLVGVNVVGAAVVFVLADYVLLMHPMDDGLFAFRLVNTIIVLVLFTAIGCVVCTRHTRRKIGWMLEGRPANRQEQIDTLRLPLQTTLIDGSLWLLATIYFALLTAAMDQSDWLLRIVVTMIDGGIVTCANAYLLSEFALRPIAARALQYSAPPRRLLAAGVKQKMVFFWAVGSAVPVAGVMLTAVVALVERDVSITRLAVVVLVLGTAVLVFGAILMVLAARSVVAPVRSVRNALAVLGTGDLDVRVPVFDGTELGSLQAGFNQLADGLRERERIRDLFGRYVGPEVVREALARDALGGQERFVAVMFVDLVGSTELAATRPPTEVVRLLNRFFAAVVDEVDRHGGLVNKFAGDAVLAVFGTPTEVPDAAGSALATARALAMRLRTELPEATAGIGVTAGIVVAGTVGDERRHEYTVIGDPVNEAARLSELAKSASGRLVASMKAVAEAGPAEAEHWSVGDEVVVRGRTSPTRLAVPAAG
jgi:adenylate cyclase